MRYGVAMALDQIVYLGGGGGGASPQIPVVLLRRRVCSPTTLFASFSGKRRVLLVNWFSIIFLYECGMALKTRVARSGLWC
jgi:hypothetical protein